MGAGRAVGSDSPETALKHQLAKVSSAPHPSEQDSGTGGAGGHLCHPWAPALPRDIYSRSTGGEQGSAAKARCGHGNVRNLSHLCLPAPAVDRTPSATPQSGNPCQKRELLAQLPQKQAGKALHSLVSKEPSCSLVSFPLALTLVNSN